MEECGIGSDEYVWGGEGVTFYASSTQYLPIGEVIACNCLVIDGQANFGQALRSLGSVLKAVYYHCWSILPRKPKEKDIARAKHRGSLKGLARVWEI